MNKKQLKLLVIGAVVLALLGLAFWKYESGREGGEAVFCTMDAKLCPDGSYVGRMPPACEFKACPGSIEISNPASQNCLDKGGRLEMRIDATGGQYGVCISANNVECDEWALYRGECSF
ncbi:MAG: DUF333 domain-containing protein [Patescibacteria group bacterium]|nr:DUF333 domain-containing protein [Patescibacteria group bacterium]MCL5261849.1 DUF333 domain-containing protein [Patescibacteria group bacterium]